MFLDITGDGSGEKIYIDCLPYKPKKPSFFTIGYTNIIYKESSRPFAPAYAGTWWDTRLHLGGSIDGRNWELAAVNLTTSGTVYISGCYEIAD